MTECDLPGRSMRTILSGWSEVKYPSALRKVGKLFILNLTSHFLLGLVEPYLIHAQLSISNRLKGNPCRCLELLLCIAPSCLVLCPPQTPTASAFPNSSLCLFSSQSCYACLCSGLDVPPGRKVWLGGFTSLVSPFFTGSQSCASCFSTS